MFRLSASPFCQTPQKEPKGLAPPSGFSPRRKIPSSKRSFRGTPRRAIPGPSWLSRHPCRSTPETPLQRGLLNGAFGVCGSLSGNLQDLQPQPCCGVPVGADLVREILRGGPCGDRQHQMLAATCRSELAREPPGTVGRIPRQRYPPWLPRRITRSGLCALQPATLAASTTK